MHWAVALAALPPAAMLAILVRIVLQARAARMRRRRRIQKREAPRATGATQPAPRMLAVLGSGGHTAEMLTLLSDVLAGGVVPAHVTYAVGATDGHSARKAAAMHAGGKVPYDVRVVPRAREVGQAWVSSALAALRTVAFAVPLVVGVRPRIVLCNGPGTAAVVAGVVLVMNAAAVTDARVVYIESVSRVVSLSLSGRLLYPFVHRFLVQWPELQALYPLVEYYGRLC